MQKMQWQRTAGPRLSFLEINGKSMWKTGLRVGWKRITECVNLLACCGLSQLATQHRTSTG